MQKTAKGGLILAMLMVGNAQAALVKVDLTGTVNYGYQNIYDYNYNTGNYNSSYNDLTGTQAHFSFIFDTSKAPDMTDSYSYSGYDSWAGNYSYSYITNYFSSAISSMSGNIGGTDFTFGNPTAYAQNYSWSYDNYGSGSSNGSGLYGYTNDYADSSYDYKYFGISNWDTNPVDVQDFLSAFLSSANPISFYLENYVGSWNNDTSSYNNLYAYGTFDNFFISTVGNFSASPSAVPVPAAVWLFGSTVMGLFGIRKRKGMMPMLTA